MDRIGPITLQPRRLSTFQSLVQAIIHQQLSGRAAAAILSRFQALYGEQIFPTPEQVLRSRLTRLTSAGMSRAKASYVQEIARRTVSGELPCFEKCDLMSDVDLVEVLTKVKGIGRWTAEMLLIFNLGRPDFLPVDDLGIRKGFQIANRKRKLPGSKQLAKFGQKWSPHRTTVTWYLWRAADFLKAGV
jgi:3-methyladenine DNA glycosylase/8-oxoguanine DNA glycosylase